MKPSKSQPKSEPSIETSALALAQRSMSACVMQPLNAPADAEEVSSVRDSNFENTANTLFKPSWSLQPVDRLEIYNKQYWYRVLDSMLEDFPGLNAILGNEKFDVLVTAYLVANPSTTYSLRDLGDKLAAFINERPELTGADQSLAHQMCSFEWAAIEAFDRKRYPTIPPNSLSSGNPESLVLVLQPYVSLLETDYALDDFAIKVDKTSAQHGVSTAQAVRCHEDSEAMRPKRKHLYLAIHRLQNHVYYKRIDQEQFQLLNAIKAGMTIGEACNDLAGGLSATRLATLPARLQKYFSDWMELGWFADPTAIT